MHSKNPKRWGGFEKNKAFYKTDTLHLIPIPKVVNISECISETINFSDKTCNDSNQQILDRKINLKNALVTQTVEINNQTEMIGSLIDTYSNNRVSFQVMPNIDFPISNSAKINQEKKFQKPLWFVLPLETNFSSGMSKNYVTGINKSSVNQIQRKALCGLLKVSGFADINESALDTMVDSIDHFYKTLMEKIILMKSIETTTTTEISILLLERAYSSMTGKSLISLHNHIKNDLYQKNRQEISQFKEAMNEYNKLLQENNFTLHQKDFFLHVESDYKKEPDDAADTGYLP